MLAAPGLYSVPPKCGIPVAVLMKIADGEPVALAAPVAGTPHPPA